MTEFFFPDNTVLCNFAAVDRLDLLKSVTNGRGRWCEAVAYEASRSAATWPALATLSDEGWLDRPIEITKASDVQAIERIRRAVFAKRGDGPLKHLGEAQTCYVIKNWKEFAGSWWITDDREALRYAKFQGITTRETVDLVAIAAINGDITAPDGYALLTRMADCERVLRMPATAAELIRLHPSPPYKSTRSRSFRVMTLTAPRRCGSKVEGPGKSPRPLHSVGSKSMKYRQGRPVRASHLQGALFVTPSQVSAVAL